MTFPHVHGDHDPCPISRRLGATTRDWRAMPPPSSALQARCASCCRSSPPSLRGSQSSGGRTPPVHNPTTRQMKAYTTAQAMAHHLFLNLLEIAHQLVRGGGRCSEIDQKAAIFLRVWVSSADVDSLLLGRLHSAVASILCTSEVFQILPAQSITTSLSGHRLSAACLDSPVACRQLG